MKEGHIPTVEIPDALREQHSKAVEDIAYRFDKGYEMVERGGETCFPRTLALTHPDHAHRYRLDRPVPNLLLHWAAKEVTQLSGEKFEYGIFGGGATWKKDKVLQKPDLARFLQDANAVWFGTVDSQFSAENEETEEEKGYNHIIGIVPYKSPYFRDTYIVEDTSGHIEFEPRNSDELYENIRNLPVGEDYLQLAIAFRERKSSYKPKKIIDEYFFFTS